MFRSIHTYIRSHAHVCLLNSIFSLHSSFTSLFAAFCGLIVWRDGQRAPNESRADKKSNHLHYDLHLHHNLHKQHHLRCEPSSASQWHDKEQLSSYSGHHLPQPASTFRQKSCSGTVTRLHIFFCLCKPSHVLKISGAVLRIGVYPVFISASHPMFQG